MATQGVELDAQSDLLKARQVVAELRDLRNGRTYPLFLGYNVLGRCEPHHAPQHSVAAHGSQYRAEFLDLEDSRIHRQHAVIEARGLPFPKFFIKCHTPPEGGAYNGLIRLPTVDDWDVATGRVINPGAAVKLSPVVTGEMWYPLYLSNVIVLAGAVAVQLQSLHLAPDVTDGLRVDELYDASQRTQEAASGSPPPAHDSPLPLPMVNSSGTKAGTEPLASYNGRSPPHSAPAPIDGMATFVATLVPDDFGATDTLIAPAEGTYIPPAEREAEDNYTFSRHMEPTQIAAADPTQLPPSSDSLVGSPVCTGSAGVARREQQFGRPGSRKPTGRGMLAHRMMQDDMDTQLGAYDGLSQMPHEQRATLEASNDESEPEAASAADAHAPVAAVLPRNPLPALNNSALGDKHMDGQLAEESESQDICISSLVRSALAAAATKTQSPTSRLSSTPPATAGAGNDVGPSDVSKGGGARSGRNRKPATKVHDALETAALLTELDHDEPTRQQRASKQLRTDIEALTATTEGTTEEIAPVAGSKRKRASTADVRAERAAGQQAAVPTEKLDRRSRARAISPLRDDENSALESARAPAGRKHKEKADPKGSVEPHVLCTGLDLEVKAKLGKIVAKLGGHMDEKITKATTHLVANTVLRTPNFLKGCCLVPNIVTPRYLSDCEGSGHWLASAGYEPQPSEDISKVLPSFDFVEVLGRRTTLPAKPLAGSKFYLLVPVKHDELIEVIESAGGTVIQNVRQAAASAMVLWDDSKPAPAGGPQKQAFTAEQCLGPADKSANKVEW